MQEGIKTIRKLFKAICPRPNSYKISFFKTQNKNVYLIIYMLTPLWKFIQILH